jgi:hypothetical protein
VRSSGSTHLGASLAQATEWSWQTEPFCLQAIVIIDGTPDDQERFKNVLATLSTGDFLAILPTALEGHNAQQYAMRYYHSRQTSAKYLVRPFSAYDFIEVVHALREHRCEYLGG